MVVVRNMHMSDDRFEIHLIWDEIDDRTDDWVNFHFYYHNLIHRDNGNVCDMSIEFDNPEYNCIEKWEFGVQDIQEKITGYGEGCLYYFPLIPNRRKFEIKYHKCDDYYEVFDKYFYFLDDAIEHFNLEVKRLKL